MNAVTRIVARPGALHSCVCERARGGRRAVARFYRGVEHEYNEQAHFRGHQPTTRGEREMNTYYQCNTLAVCVCVYVCVCVSKIGSTSRFP